MTRFTHTLPSPFGPICLTEHDGAIIALDWGRKAGQAEMQVDGPPPTPLLGEAARQLQAYFAGDLKTFDLPLAPKGDAFQQSVAKAMLAIPYGETTTYGTIAETLGTYGQPVGTACGGNSIPIIIPCHRVLATDGVGGYSGDGGTERKIDLLKHEGGFPFLL